MESHRIPGSVVKESQIESYPASVPILKPLLPRPIPIYADMQEAHPSQQYQLGSELYISRPSQQCNTQTSASLVGNINGYYPSHTQTSASLVGNADSCYYSNNHTQASASLVGNASSYYSNNQTKTSSFWVDKANSYHLNHTQTSANLAGNANSHYPNYQDVEIPANVAISGQKLAAQQQQMDNVSSQWNNQAHQEIVNKWSSLDEGTRSFSQLQAASEWKTIVPNQCTRVQGQDSGDPLSQLNNLSFGELLAMKDIPTSVMAQANEGPTTSTFLSDLNCQPWDEAVASSAPIISENQEIPFATIQKSSATCTQDMQPAGFPCEHWKTYDLNLPLRTENILISGIGQVIQPAAGDPCQRSETNSVADDKSSCAGSSSNKQNEKAENQVAASRVDELEKQAAESLSTMIEGQKPDEGGNNTDPNKAPQQKPRRKKHRPKVISEKPKRTAKPKVPRATNPDGTPKPKRKYTRKNKIDPPSTPPPQATSKEAVNPRESDSAAKSCRRGLNFDLDSQEKILPTKNTSTAGIKSVTAVDLTQDDKLTAEMAQAESTHDPSCKVNQVLQDGITVFEKGKLSKASQQAKANAVYESEVNGNYQAAAANSMKGKEVETMLSKNYLGAPSPNSSASANSNIEENKGIKRAYSYIHDEVHANDKNTTITHGAFWQSSLMYLQNSIQFPGARKKKRSEKVQRPFTPSATKHDQYCTQFVTSAAPNHQANALGAAEDRLQVMMTWEDLEKLKKKRSKVPTRVRDLSSLTGLSAGWKLPTKPNKPKRAYNRRKKGESSNSTSACMEALAAYSSVTHTTKKRSRKRNSNISLDRSNIHATTMQRRLVQYEGPKSVRNHSGPYLALPWRDPISVEAITYALKQLDISREMSQTGSQVENSLVLYSANDQAQNALVLYKKDGTMVPFKGSHDPIRKRQPRAKVHLDDETNRVWRLLLENINNEGIDGTDEEKAKWWANERKVFCGRVDSFIARMRLVQGDRRFSPWKGSVVDSCVGVFLTQNVSDHLSSSAFMSMVARFPLKPEGTDSEGDSILVEEPTDYGWTERTLDAPVCDRISRTFHDIDHGEEKEVVNSRELLGDISPNDHYCSNPCQTECRQKTPDESITAQGTETESTSKGVDYIASLQYPVVSSQNFAESPNAPTAGRVSSCSDSNSEQEDPMTSYSTSLFDYPSSFVQLLKMAESPTLHEDFLRNPPPYLMHEQTKAGKKQHHQQELIQNADCTQELDEESRSSDNLSRKCQNYTTEQSDKTTDLATKFRLCNKNPDSIQKPSCSAEKTCPCYVFEGEKTIIESQQQLTKQYHPDLPSSLKNDYVTENISISGEKISNNHTLVKPNSDEGRASVDTLNENTTKQKKGHSGKGKSRMGKSGKDTKPAFDWDSLRKQAQAVDGIRGKTANTMDSLDWEAVRRADVSEIAETIKYRGMNNMLAERIKDFLDRLVREHGSIDLEWLRDVPPDKAKEYLLSIRGLGLKSVECVRLLTLHHLAFPVDTNVGRIAVRLGWVPLQPLPESLQLHLLEMYPVLESIQKYLWPRLCKLDQRTLYELHYHMITFGKVFCTKRQPNCNACPLRGECRHFASAFASARLSLPGPEEKSIVTATQGPTAHYEPQVAINPLSLPPAQENLQSEVCPDARNCEPIVEVPASPEPEQAYNSEHDIEDAFFEDPDDIPTIRLNMEQFTQTLQNYMQGNMELQEAEMSKALVALTPEAATIQIPKLKNVSRLRTEHHVYELPDYHPLLEGLDKREPDDPCSYLLAIWTPGETANSIQPPEKRCTSEGLGELCEDVTCFYCNSQREASSQIVRGTLLIPCRTAMRGSFPLNGTYFQVNEVFADHNSSMAPLSIPRSLIWDLPRRTVYFGTSVPSIFRGLSTEGIQHCFWKGYVCVRGFDQKTRAPRPLMARLHFPASKRTGTKGKGRQEEFE